MCGAWSSQREHALASPDGKLDWFFTVVVRAGLLYGQVHTTNSTDGGAVWLSPGNRLTFGPMIRTGLILMPLKLGWAGFQRAMKLNGHLDQVHSEVVPEPHWYLMALGVRPGVQGRGIGSALLQPVLLRADAEKRPCYLETFEESNLRFYARQGFEVSGEGRIPDGGPRYWTMLREAVA